MNTMTVLDRLPGTVHVIDARFIAPGALRVTTLNEAHARLAAAALLQAGFDVARNGASVTAVEPENTE